MTQGRPYVDDQPEPPAKRPSARGVTSRGDGSGVLAKLREYDLLGLAETVAKRHGIPLSVLFNADARKFKPLVRCRDEIFAAVRDVREWSWPMLGELFGLDHTTVMDAAKRHRARRPLNPNAVGNPGEGTGPPAGELSVTTRPACAQPDAKPSATGVSSGPVLGTAAPRACSESGSGSSQLSNLSNFFPAAAVSSDAREAAAAAQGSVTNGQVETQAEDVGENDAAARSPDPTPVPDAGAVHRLPGRAMAEYRSPEQRTLSPNAQLIADRIRQHAELSSLDATAIADKFEGVRMIASKPAVADVLTAIDDYALTVTGQPNAPAALQKGLRTYMQNARPPKPAAVLGQPGGGKGQERGSTGIKYKTFAVEKADDEDYVAPPSSAELAKRAEALLAQLGTK